MLTFDAFAQGRSQNVPMESSGKGVTATATFAIDETKWHLDSTGKLKRVR